MITTQYESALNKLALMFQLLLPLLLLLILPLVLILVLILSSNTLLATTQIYTIQELAFFDKELDKAVILGEKPSEAPSGVPSARDAVSGTLQNPILETRSEPGLPDPLGTAVAKEKLQEKEPDVCYLDFTKKALSKINREMSKEVNKGMNKDINAAIDDAEMNTGINDEEIDKILNKSLLEQISDNLQCRFRAATLGITKVPAVVIDDKVLVYGTRSIKQAYDLYALKERGNNG